MTGELSSRRSVLVRGGRTLAAGGLAGLGLASAAEATLPRGKRTEDDAERLVRLLELELAMVAVYARFAHLPVLTPPSRRVIAELRGHEREHAAVLASALKDYRVSPPRRAHPGPLLERALAVSHLDRTMGELRRERDYLGLLVGLEAVAEGEYYGAMSKLEHPELIRLAMSIMAVEAQHSSVLGLLLHRGDVVKAVPDAFVQGRR